MTDVLLTVQRDIESPPGGWKYTVPETGVTVTGQFYKVLRDRVVKHLKANNLPVDEALIEDGACRETRPPGSWCARALPKPVAGRPLALLIYVEQFLKCTWQAILARRFVGRDEAVRRFDICMGCPMRAATPGGCAGCYDLLRKANTVMESKGALTVAADADGVTRDACSACWCLIPLKVWLRNDTLDKCEGEKKPPYWEGCWRINGS